MKKLDLDRLWQTLNVLSNKQSELAEQNIYVQLLGNRSNYGETSFENFLSYYSFRIEGNEIIVFNNDPVSWEEFNNDDFSYVPIRILYFDEERLEKWMENKIKKQLEQQEKDKLAEKEDIKERIEHLQKQLNNL